MTNYTNYFTLSLDDQKGFVVLPRRWVVERTFAWITQCRRLGKDYETQPETSEALIYLAMTRLMLQRLAPIDLCIEKERDATENLP